MTDLLPVLVPMINPNETEALLSHLVVKPGQKVKKGDLLAVFETTKSTFELLSDAGGFIVGLTANEGDLLKINTLLCYLAERADMQVPSSDVKDQASVENHIPSGLRITQPALELARQNQIDLDSLPVGELITEKTIRVILPPQTQTEVDPTALIIYGGGGHAKALIDLIRAENRYRIVGLLDDGVPAGSLVLDVPVLGDGGLLGELRQKGIGQAVNAVGGIGNIAPRLQVYEKLRSAGFRCPNVIHPRAVVETSAKLGEGGQFFYNSYTGSDVKIAFGCIINTSAILSHDCVLDDFVNISPGAILAGGVKVGTRSLIGMGVTINLNVTIGAGCRIGNSAVIKADVPDNGIVRAGTIWPEDSAVNRGETGKKW